MAAPHSALGRIDQALDYIERGYEERNGWIQSIGVDAMYDNLRDHPRFKAMLRKMNLPE